MKKRLELPKTSISCPPEKEGESIEEKMRKVVANNEPIDNVAPLIYTDRKDGVLPQYDHRTDRFELARMATDRVNATRIAMAQAAQEAAEQAREGRQTTAGEA